MSYNVIFYSDDFKELCVDSFTKIKKENSKQMKTYQNCKYVTVK